MGRIKLRDYQHKAIEDARGLLRKGIKSFLIQLPTGAGKTVVFSSIAKSFISRSSGRILIVVHRKELRKQAANTLSELFELPVFEILPGSKYVPDRNIYVGLVQTVKNRLHKLPPIDLVIIDEAHLNHFKKIHDNIAGDPIFIGVSATPISASKKHPTKDTYSDIVVGPQIKRLISDGALSQNYTYAPKMSIDRDQFRKDNRGDFLESDMAEAFSKQKNIKTCRIAYEKHSLGHKTIIFNVNIEHSYKVVEEFIEAGHTKIRHVDGKTKTQDRERIFDWFAKTDGAILCNVGIATMGFDEPTIETVIVNRSTTSIPLWLQMTGRGSRVTDTKKKFNIIDLGGNAANLGDWNADRDWHHLFHNPDKPGKGGIAPVKSCPECDAIIAARTLTCPYCFHEMESMEKEEFEVIMEEFEMVTKDIVVQKEINFSKSRGFKKYHSFFNILEKIAKQYKPEIHEQVMEAVHEKAKEWNNKEGNHYTQNRKKFTEERFKEILLKHEAN